MFNVDIPLCEPHYELIHLKGKPIRGATCAKLERTDRIFDTYIEIDLILGGN